MLFVIQLDYTDKGKCLEQSYKNNFPSLFDSY